MRCVKLKINNSNPIELASSDTMAPSQAEIISAELDELKRVCESSVPGSRLVACVPQSIRVEVS